MLNGVVVAEGIACIDPWYTLFGEVVHGCGADVSWHPHAHFSVRLAAVGDIV